MVLRAAVDAGAGGTIVTSVTGTANQVTASPTTGAVIVGLAPISQIATSLAIGGATIGTDALGVTGTASISGNVGIGMASSSQKLQVAGSIYATAGDFIAPSTRGMTWDAGASNLRWDNSGNLHYVTAGTAFYFGGVDVDTAPVAQIVRTQGALAGGTSNIAGANWTFIASPGKGTGIGGSFIFQTAPAGVSGTVVGTPTTVLILDSTQLATFTGALSAVGSLTFTTNTSGIVLKRGANGLCGTFVANGATPVVVSNTNVAITDSIIISLNTIGGTVGVQPHVSAITGATSFAVTCTAVDTSTYNYTIIKNAA